MNFAIRILAAVALRIVLAQSGDDGGYFGSWVQYSSSTLPYFAYTLDQIHDGNASVYNRSVLP